MKHFIILYNVYVAWSVFLQFYTANHGMLCYVYWKSRDWRLDIPWNHPDSCNSRGKSRRNKKGIFTVCPTAVYLTAALSLGNSNRRRRPRHPDRRRRSNIAGKQAVISKVLKKREHETSREPSLGHFKCPIHRSCINRTIFIYNISQCIISLQRNG